MSSSREALWHSEPQKCCRLGTCGEHNPRSKLGPSGCTFEDSELLGKSGPPDASVLPVVPATEQKNHCTELIFAGHTPHADSIGLCTIAHLGEELMISVSIAQCAARPASGSRSRHCDLHTKGRLSWVLLQGQILA
eukprot:2402334-Rhodomonas_salina.1